MKYQTPCENCPYTRYPHWEATTYLSLSTQTATKWLRCMKFVIGGCWISISRYLIDTVAQWFRAPAYIVGGCWFDSSPCCLSFPRSPRTGFQQRTRIIVTSPAKDERSRSWMKQLPGGILATAYLMNPFFLKEYLLTGFVDLYLFFCFV